MAFHIDGYGDGDDIREEIEGEFVQGGQLATEKQNFIVLGPSGPVGKSSFINMMVGQEFAKPNTQTIDKYQSEAYSFYDTPQFASTPRTPAKVMLQIFQAIDKKKISGLIICEDSSSLNLNPKTEFLFECLKSFLNFPSSSSSDYSLQTLLLATKSSSADETSTLRDLTTYTNILKQKFSSNLSHVIPIGSDSQVKTLTIGKDSVEKSLAIIGGNSGVFSTTGASQESIARVVFRVWRSNGTGTEVEEMGYGLEEGDGEK